MPAVRQKLLVRMREGEDEDRANKERERNMCKLTLFGVHPVLKTTVSNAFHVHKDMLLEDATELGWKVRSKDFCPPVFFFLLMYATFISLLYCGRVPIC